MKPSSNHRVRLFFAAALLAAGCAQAPLIGAAPQVATATLHVVPADRSLQDTLPPTRLMPGDVFEYDCTLYQQVDGNPVAVSGVVPVVLNQKGSTPQTQASFSNLALGKVYEIGIVAKGNTGGTAAEHVLNDQVPTYAVVDLTGTPKLTDGGVTVNAIVELNPVPGDPSLPLGVNGPTEDGAWADPSAAPTIEPTTTPTPGGLD